MALSALAAAARGLPRYACPRCAGAHPVRHSAWSGRVVGLLRSVGVLTCGGLHLYLYERER